MRTWERIEIPLFRQQLARLVEDAIANANLTDVVQQTAVAADATQNIVGTEQSGGPAGVASNHLAVAVRVGVFGLDGVSENADDGEIGTQEFVLEPTVLQSDAGLIADR